MVQKPYLSVFVVLLSCSLTNAYPRSFDLGSDKESGNLEGLMHLIHEKRSGQLQPSNYKQDETDSQEAHVSKVISPIREEGKRRSKGFLKNSNHRYDIDHFLAHPDANSNLADIVESMLIERRNETKPHQISIIKQIVKNKTRTIEMKSDRHPLTRKQMRKLGLIPEEEPVMESVDGLKRKKKNFAIGDSGLWPNGTVYYEIQSDLKLDRKYVDTIENAIKQFEDLTCIKWVEIKPSYAEFSNIQSYVSFVNESGCWSYIGRIGQKQQLSLSTPGCVHLSVVLHEMCHALGQYHEQSRSDRDDYVIIDETKVKNANMAKMKTKDLNPYDLGSILQYPLNGDMRLKDDRLQFLPDSAESLSFYDVMDITDAYKCSEKCQTKPICQNGGFVNHRCVCYCPEGLTGSQCETVITDSDCGGVVSLSSNSSINITTPNYPNQYSLGKICTWLIKAPDGYFLNMTLLDLRLTVNRACNHWLEIRYNLLGQNGIKRCGFVNGSESYVTTKDEYPNMMFMRFDSYTNIATAAPDAGFLLNIRATGPGCSYKPCYMGVCSAHTDDGSFDCTCFPGYSGKLCDTMKSTTSSECDFEPGSGCIMQNSQSDDDFNWEIRSGGTPSSGTGPSSAHGGQYYLYIEASYPRRNGEKAVYETNIILEAANRCLSFWYHMYGSTVGTLKVLVDGEPKWTKTGNQNNTWWEANVNIPYSAKRVSFESSINQWQGDIALDDVRIVPGLCG